MGFSFGCVRNMGQTCILCHAAAINLTTVIAEQEGVAQHKFPDPVEGRAQGQPLGPPIPVVRVDVVAVGIVAICICLIFSQQPAGPCRTPPYPPPTVVNLITLNIGAGASLVVADCCLLLPLVIGAGCREGLGVKTAALLMTPWWWNVAR